MATGTGDALRITNRAPNIANIGLLIENNVLAGPAEGPGVALRLQGIGTHHIVVRANQIENGIHLATADGVTIEDCLIFGVKPGVIVDLVAGAFQTRIIRNGFVARDGALLVLNGSQIYFEHNTVEQFPAYGANVSIAKASIAIRPTAYGSRHIQIVSNNFGGGDNAGASIHVSGDCRHLLVDRNVFNVNAAGNDVVLTDAAVAWTRIGPNNSVRGPEMRRPHLGAGDTVSVEDGGTGTYGVLSGKAIHPISPWRAAEKVVVRKSLENVLRFQGSLSGSGPAGGAIAKLSVGFRPLSDATVLAIGDQGITVPLRFEAAGLIRLLAAASGLVSLDGLSVLAALPPAPPPSDP